LLQNPNNGAAVTGLTTPTYVYCAARPSATEDHVFARGNLPKVPVCSTCNGAKANLRAILDGRPSKRLDPQPEQKR